MPLHVRQHPLHNAHILPPDSPASQQLQQDRNHRQWNAVWPPDDGREDARNMLRKNWLPINRYLLHVGGSRLYLHISCVGWFMSYGCYCRGWFPRSLYATKFLTTWVLFETFVVLWTFINSYGHVAVNHASHLMDCYTLCGLKKYLLFHGGSQKHIARLSVALPLLLFTAEQWGALQLRVGFLKPSCKHRWV